MEIDNAATYTVRPQSILHAGTFVGSDLVVPNGQLWMASLLQRVRQGLLPLESVSSINMLVFIHTVRYALLLGLPLSIACLKTFSR